jgi:hypothetical protein
LCVDRVRVRVRVRADYEITKKTRGEERRGEEERKKSFIFFWGSQVSGERRKMARVSLRASAKVGGRRENEREQERKRERSTTTTT